MNAQLECHPPARGSAGGAAPKRCSQACLWLVALTALLWLPLSLAVAIPIASDKAVPVLGWCSKDTTAAQPMR